MELTRAAVHAFATQASKLKPEVKGDASPALKALLPTAPNPYMDTSKFLYRLATILENDTTAFVVPLTDQTGAIITGYWPLLPQSVEIVDVAGEAWVRYQFSNGQRAAIEFSRVGILTKFQYADDFFGSGNTALSPTLDVLDIQRQAMQEAVKSSANIRFMGRLSQVMRPEDIKAERDRFSADNLAAENTSGIILADQKYSELKQIESKPWVIEAAQMELIKDNVFSYFGVNDDILQNKYNEDTWNAFYEGKVEPFAIQLSLTLTNMTFDQKQRAAGSGIMFSSNRLQYASNTSKVSVVQNLVDRGIMSSHQAADVFNLPVPPGEERWVIRGEYIDVNNLPAHTVGKAKAYLQMQPGADEEAPADESQPVPTEAAPAENLQATALNGAQITALIAVAQALQAGTLTLGQAANIVAVALAIDIDAAKDIVEGRM